MFCSVPAQITALIEIFCLFLTKEFGKKISFEGHLILRGGWADVAAFFQLSNYFLYNSNPWDQKIVCWCVNLHQICRGLLYVYNKIQYSILVNPPAKLTAAPLCLFCNFYFYQMHNFERRFFKNINII